MKIEAATDEHTTSQIRMFALPRNEAFERLSAKDRRPLLVVRECNKCKGTDDALLARALDNEKTLLLSKFFHCVKLKQHVLDEDHTFNQLFAGKAPPHLFLATPDGKQMLALPGTQSQKALWDTMFKLLDIEYERDARKAVKEMVKLLSRYDHLDSMEDMYLEQVDLEIEKRGPRSPKLKTIRAKLAKIRGQKDAAKLRETKILDLGLKRAATE